MRAAIVVLQPLLATATSEATGIGRARRTRSPALGLSAMRRESARSRDPRRRTAGRSQPDAPRLPESGRAGRAWSAGSRGHADRTAQARSHLSRYPKRFVVGNAPDEMLQQGGVAAAESPPLGGEPAVEDRAAVDLQALEEVAVEQPGQRPLPLRARASRCPPRSRGRPRSHRRSNPPGRAGWCPRGCRRAGGHRSSTKLRILLRHQRSSPRGSLGTSHSSSQSWLLDTAAARGPDRRGARAPCGTPAAPARRRPGAIVRGPSMRTSSAGSPPGRRTDRIPRHFHAGYHARLHVCR